jgi:hypothetical protein
MQNIESGGETAETTTESEPVMLIIDSLQFSGGTVTSTSAQPGVENHEIRLPGFSMSGIGRPNGTTPDVIASEVTTELLSEIITAAAKAGIEKAIEEKKKSLTDKLFGRD